ncbi:MAG: adenine-specific methyltransferase EcoRI family protein [Candidatus Pacebacteria bacterium]|nr:adenine-specific methyltransferase EcoRI family protein [Candidatus Paceibacterota bacterium]
MTEKKSSNSNLRKANKVKNDEFYTQLFDIENELKYYKNQFRGKIVYCNCDDPFESNFFKYFASNFKALGLKRLITTSYKPSPVANTQLALFGNDKTLAPKKGRSKINANKFIINDVGDLDGDGSFDLQDIAEQLRANKNNEWSPLEGDGDFRNPESIELLKKADIVVTNPPFSLFREYVVQLIQYKKSFLILGNDNALGYKEIFKLVKNNYIWPGYSHAKEFKQPDGTLKTFGNISWYTNLDTTKRHEELILYKKYSAQEFSKFDNYDAINIDKTTDIPADFKGVMGVPISFLHKYNPNQFEIIDGLNRYTILDVAKKNDWARKNHIHMTEINGRSKFFRVLIKNKKPQK